jgi:ribosomal protein S15P/S13E
MSEEVCQHSESEFVAWVAIDWADKKHVWRLETAGARARERGELQHTPEAIEAWANRLAERFGGRRIAVGLEQSRGSLICALTKYAHLVLYPIHPTTLARFRAALFPSGAKDDPVDADLLLELLLHHRGHLRRLEPDTVETRRLQFLVEQRRTFVNEKTRQTNRLTAQLKMYYPQILQWFEEVDSPLVGALLLRWPTLEKLQKARPATLRDFFHQHHCRGAQRIEQRLQQIGQAISATHDVAVVESGVLAAQLLVRLIATLRKGIAELDRRIEKMAAAHPDFALFDSLPGAGKVMAPRLIVAFGTQRERYASAQEVQAYTGIAPVLERSGKTACTHFRWTCPKFLRQTFHEWAGHSLSKSEWARLYYQRQRARGKAHHAVVRALAFKWIRIIFRCWKSRTPYDEQVYLRALQQRHSPPAVTDSPTVNLQWIKHSDFWKLSTDAS